MKKQITLLAAILTVSGMLAGCGENDNQNNDEQTVDVTKYSVKFMNGTTLFTEQSVEEGKLATKPSTNPTKNTDQHYTYEFEEWLLGGVKYDWATPVTEDITLEASWKSSVRKYDIKFMNDEDIIDSKKLEYGETIVAPINDLSFEKDGYKYNHLGWSLPKSDEIIEDFGTVVGDVTYYPVFDGGELITYKATVKFDYEGGASDAEVEYTAENRAEKLLAIEEMLPEEDDTNIYSWKEALPDVLPFEDSEFTVVANSKYFAVDMSDSNINSNIELINRSGSASLAVEDGALKFSSTNDVFFLKRSYTNFDLEFNLKSNSDLFSFVLGANENNMNANYGEGAPQNAINGTAFIVMKLTHATSRVRPYGNGAQIESCPNNSAIETPSLSDGVKVKLHCEGNHFEVYINDVLDVAREFVADAYTPGGYVGIFAPSATMEFSSFSINKLVMPDKTFSSSFEDNKLPNSLKYIHNVENGGYSITDNVFTAGFGYSGGSADILGSYYKYKTFDLEMTIKLDANGGGDARVNLDFAMPSLTPNTNHGSNSTGECIVLVPSGQGARWYAAGSKTRNDPAFDISKITSQFMTIKLSVRESSYSISVDGGTPVTLNSSFNGAEGYILLTSNSDRQTAKISIQSISIVEYK